METGWFVFLTLLVVGLTALFSYALVKTYVDSRDASYLTSFVSVCALTITLLCVFLIPLDIYTVSSSLYEDGTQTNLELVKKTGEGVKYLYYVLYSGMVLFAFIILPFVYFYFEEEGETTSTSVRACSAAKYTAGFFVVFIVLLTIGLVIRTDKSDPNDNWKTKLSSSFTAGDAIISFTINCLAVLGMAGWIMYPSYGLANFPLNLMRGSTPVNEYSGVRSVRVPVRSGASRTTSTSSSSSSLPSVVVHTEAEYRAMSVSDLNMELRRNTENLAYLQSQYDLTGRTWTTQDRQQQRKLEQERRQIESLLASRSINSSSSSSSSSSSRGIGAFRANISSRCATIWNATAPLRIAVAVPLVLISLLIIISMFLSTLDKFLHSPCKLSCGYALSKSTIVNPIDASLQYLSRAFPMDLIAFSGLVIYIFVATISGLVSLGVRILIFKLYGIHKYATPPHAMLMATWFLMFIVLVLNQQMLTLTPQYASFGEQFYLERSNTTGQIVHQPCTIERSGQRDDQCRLTQIATFINTSSIQTPFFSIILFFTNLLFLAAFFIFLLYGLCRTKRSFQQERERLLDDPDMYDSE